ncbi:DNA mismatch endonuclease Vsr [Ruegeria sp. HKCCD4884]|uniref:very short patch repair endonuclease n=1 Tax=Ruegeria sp. HKCCD4884 TaxID=2683022 RepID=UPI0014915229|nr:very short patch repair endonuclease [Ruegeria sp. HKCCD4884]NOD92512.1 DNA mismatch endonuclease Vsr [Ruegeria sp. HKCCD4884]
MSDPLTPEQRRKVMQGNRGKNTKLELAVRRGLHARGLRYRLHGSKSIGSPDIVFPRYGAVVFVHGCFWHQHSGCRLAASVRGKTHDRWESKFLANIERDARNIRAAREAGYRVAVVWECAVEHRKKMSALRDGTLEQLEQWLRDGASEQIIEIG